MAGKSPTAPDAPHGTAARYQLHLRRKEVPCDACNDANNAKSGDLRSKLIAQRRAVLEEAVGWGSYGGIAGGS